MGKTTKRVISMILSVLMVLSMVSVFCMPTLAAPEANVQDLDYDALRTAEDTIIINGAWTAEDLVADGKVSYYFRGQTYEETYNANRHFATWAAAYAVYAAKLNATNIGSYVPTFIFAPGTYNEAVTVHGNAIILGANAGINPNDPAEEWTTTAMSDGWAANSDWAADNETVLNAGVQRGTREGTAETGPYQNYLEQFDTTAGKKSTISAVVDGCTFKTSKGFGGQDWDIGKKTKDAGGNDTDVMSTGGRTENRYLQNCNVRDWNGNEFDGLFVAWDTSHKTNNAHMINVRFEGNTISKSLYFKYFTNATIDGCYFPNFGVGGDGWAQGQVFGRSTDNLAFGWSNTSFSRRIEAGSTQQIEFKNSVWYKSNTNGPLSYGIGAGNDSNGIFNVNLNFTGNIVYDQTISTGAWGFFVPYNTSKAGSKVSLTVINNQFEQQACDVKAPTNFGEGYQMSSVAYTMRENTFIGRYQSLWGNGIRDTATQSTVFTMDFGDNFWGDTAESVGKAPVDLNGLYPENFANDFDISASEYYLDYAKTVKNTAIVFKEVTGLGDKVSVEGSQITAVCSDLTGSVAPVFKTYDATATATLYEEDIATPVTSINFDAITDDFVVYNLRFEIAGITKDYTVKIIVADAVDFVTSLEAGDIEGFSDEDTFVYINGATLGETYFGYFNGVYYSYTVDNDYVYNTFEGIANTVEGIGIDQPSIILISKEYGDLTVPFGATFYGVNYDVNPIDDSEAEKVEDDWKLNSNWGEYGETGIGTITVGADVKGELNFYGITMRSQFNDVSRVVSQDTSNNYIDDSLAVTFKNTVVDHIATPSLPQLTNTGGNSRFYLFNLSTTRASNSIEAFNEVFNDTFTMQNLYVKKSAIARFINERVPSAVTIDHVYVDGVGSGMTGLVGWMKNGPANSFNYTVKNSMFRNIGNASFFYFQPQAEIKSDSSKVYDVTLTNNKFINEDIAGVASTTFITVSDFAKRVSSFTFDGNTVLGYKADCKALSFTGLADANADGIDDTVAAGTHALSAADVSVKDNNFIGTIDDFGFKTVTKAENTFYTPNAAYVGLTGRNCGANSENYYWCNIERTAKSIDFDIISMAAGSSPAQGIAFDNVSRTISFQLPSGSTAGMTIQLPEGAVGQWHTSDMTTVANVEFSALTANTSTYYYTVTNNGLSVTYTASIDNYVPEDFVGNFTNDILSDSALLVTSQAANAVAGSVVSYRLAGRVYDFYVGTNAFASLEDAYAYATAQSIAVPEIFLATWAERTDLSVDRAVKLYAPNFDTVPYIAEAYGDKSDGSTWTDNSDYMDNQMIVKNIKIGANATGTVEFYGFTFTGDFYDNTRTVDASAPTPAKTTVKLVNTLKDGADAGNYLFNVGNAITNRVDNSDEFIVKNLYIKRGAASTRLIGELTPSITTFDGLFCDAVDAGFSTQAAWIKSPANTWIFTIKNSNLRRWHRSTATAPGPLQFEGDKTDYGTRTRKLIYENNILNEFGNQTGAGGVGPWYMFRWYANTFSDFVCSNNYIDMGENTLVNAANEAYRYTGCLFHSDGIIDTNWQSIKTNVTFADNIILGALNNINIDGSVNGTNYFAAINLDVHDNFVTKKSNEDLDTAVGVGISAREHGYYPATKYWLDYARTLKSGDIQAYEFENDNTKYFANGTTKVLKYKLDEDDANVTSQTVQVDDGTGTMVDKVKYSIDMSSFVKSNPYNKITVAYGDTSVDISKPLVFNVDSALDTIQLSVTVNSADKTATPEVYSLYIASEFKDAGIDSVTVGDVDATYDAATATYSVTLPSDGADEAIVVTASTGSTAVVRDGENTITTVGTVDCSGVEYKIIATSAEATADYTLKVAREHKWNAGVQTKAPTCAAEGEMTYTCTVDPTHTKTEPIAIDSEAHDWDDGAATTASTCSAAGVKTYTCKNDPTHTKTESIAINPDAHDWDDGVVTTAPTCQSTGVRTYTCANNAEHTKTETLAIDPEAHVWDEGEVTTPATCEADGVKTFHCTNDGCTETKTEVIVKLGHNWDEGTVTTPATCEADGVKTFHCTNDGCTETKTEVIAKLGHKWGEYVYNNDATLEADGTKTRTCSVCEKTETVIAEGTKIVLVDSSKIFSDVVEGKWYKKYVDYVATMQLMIGTSETEFEPDTNLTRAMFVQILANISGVDTSDRNVTTKFIDVPANKWYTPAVKWASENGIVNGLDENNFGPSENIQRQQMCVMLVRFANFKQITLKETVAQTAFADDSQISNYAREAVYACQKAEIVNGVDTVGNFEPRGNATRSQISKIVAVFHQDYMLGK